MKVKLSLLLCRFVAINGTECDPVLDIIIDIRAPNQMAYWEKKLRTGTCKYLLPSVCALLSKRFQVNVPNDKKVPNDQHTCHMGPKRVIWNIKL